MQNVFWVKVPSERDGIEAMQAGLWQTLSSLHYCPAKISEGHPNPLKISMITHGQSENDFN
jgi:hypothetical protein